MMKTAICITLFLGMLFIAPAFIFAADCGKSPLSEDDMELCGNGFTEDGVVAPTKAKNTLSGDIQQFPLEQSRRASLRSNCQHGAASRDNIPGNGPT